MPSSPSVGPSSPPEPVGISTRDRSRLSIQAKARTLSEELGGIEHPFDSPRSSLSGVSSNATQTVRKRSSSKRRSRPPLSTASSTATLFISMAATPPAQQQDHEYFSNDRTSGDKLQMRRSISHPGTTLEEELAQAGTSSEAIASPAPSPRRKHRILQPQAEDENGDEQTSLGEETILVSLPPPSRFRRMLHLIIEFFMEFFETLRRVLVEVALPLSQSLLSLPLSILATHSPETDSQQEADQSSCREAKEPQTDTGSHFAEKFKYIICTSFLLTPFLSISFYDPPPAKAAPVESEAAVAAAAADLDELKRLIKRMPDPRQSSDNIVVSIAGLRGSKRLSCQNQYQQTFDVSSSLPPLVGRSRNVRNATFWAIVLLAVFSPTWAAWFRIALLMTTLSWSLIVADVATMGSPSTILFTVAAPEQAIAQTIDLANTIRCRLAQGEVVDSVSRLVLGAQEADKEFNNTLSAIQEVELVARGFKISRPLPPISRIEAATSQFASTPAKPKTTNDAQETSTPRSAPAWKSAEGSISRSASATSSESNTKHGGPQAGGRDSATPTRSREELRRMAFLRRNLLQSLEEGRNFCQDLIRELDSLVDHDELAALGEMYASDFNGLASAESDMTAGAAPFSGSTDSRGPSPLPMNSSIANMASAADDSILSNSSMQKRSSWGMTLPRSAVAPSAPRKPGLQGLFDTAADDSVLSSTSLGGIASPRNTPKRFSLTSDGSAAGASGTLSRNGSLLKSKLFTQDSISPDAGGWSGSETSTPRSALPAADTSSSKPRGSRLSYIAEGSNLNGPNTSPAAKRLSYQSSDSRPGSQLSQNKRDSMEAASKIQGSPITTWANSLRRRGVSSAGALLALGNNGIISPDHLQSPNPTSEDVVDPLTLLGLKNAFEQFHSIRRRALCQLLALKFTTNPRSPDGRKYWRKIRATVDRCTHRFEHLRSRAEELLSSDMSEEKWGQNGSANVEDGESDRLQSLMSLPGSTGLVPFSGFEDKAQTLAQAIRSIQVKLRACAEELQIGVPNPLHGTKAAKDNRGRQSPILSEAEIIARKESAERIWDTLREDIISLSQEWETGSKILQAEKRRGAAVGPTSPTMPVDDRNPDSSMVSEGNATGVLESPLEADEDAVARRRQQSFDEFDSLSPSRNMLASDQGDETDELSANQLDLTTLLLNSTSAAHLTPPGMEQVYESITTALNNSNEPKDGRKLTREERIQKVKEQRQEILKQQQQPSQRVGGTDAHAGVVTELKGVLDVIRSQKQAPDHNDETPSDAAVQMKANSQYGTQMPHHSFRSAQSAASPQTSLGSPFDPANTNAASFNGPPPRFGSSSDQGDKLSQSELARALAARMAMKGEAHGSRDQDNGAESSDAEGQAGFAF
ncbi:unnamed protein product [Sympodiomycopsis kandeliae]